MSSVLKTFVRFDLLLYYKKSKKAPYTEHRKDFCMTPLSLDQIPPDQIPSQTDRRVKEMHVTLSTKSATLLSRQVRKEFDK